MTLMPLRFCTARRSFELLGLALLAACGTDPRTAPQSKPIANENGDRQSAAPGHELSDPLVVRVVDVAGHASAGATVRWTTADGGAFSPEETQTDAFGRAQTIWTLGPATGSQHAHATVDGASGDDFVATAAQGGVATGLLPVALTTYDGSGQTAHPDYVAMPAQWPADHQYLTLTPYPFGNAGFENPSIYSSASLTDWQSPAGVSNPVVSPDGGYLSDPDIVSVPELDELWLYYRNVKTQNEIYVIRSRNGTTFTAPRRVAAAPNHEIVSPAVVHRGPGDWMMWSVNAGQGCTARSASVELRRSANGLDWSSPQSTQLTQAGSFFPWHIDVQWIPTRNEFWAIFNGKTPGSCTTPALFLATSPDGVRWTTYPSPILSRGASSDLADIVYRSTFAYDPATDMIDFWYSGARYDQGQYVWRSAYQRRARSEVFATAAKQGIAALAALAPARPGIPALVNPP